MTTVKFNQQNVEKRLMNAINVGQKWLDQEVITSTEPYVPMDKGTLYQSAKRYSSTGQIVYKTDYARLQYYSLKHKNPAKHPLACMRWFETSKANNSNYWIRKVKELVGTQL